jgi:ribosomal protein L11 methylase PrmA
MTVMNMNEADLTRVETHFAFGRNWAEFSEKVDEAEIGEAERGLRRLIEEKEIVSRSFLDIGCGSGLHALAALRLGAKRVVAFDIDADSVATATRTPCLSGNSGRLAGRRDKRLRPAAGKGRKV